MDSERNRSYLIHKYIILVIMIHHLFLIRDADIMHLYIMYLAYIYPEKESYINI